MEEPKDKNKRMVVIDIKKANWFAIALLVGSAIVLMIPFFLIWYGREPMISQERILGIPGKVVFFVSLLLGIVVHELIHGITWAHFTEKGWKSISFGVIWKMLTPYCHCDEVLTIRSYIIGALMPCIVLGILPVVIALCIGSFGLLLWGIIFISAAAGDLWMAWLLTKEDPKALVLDHPSEAGFYIFE